MLTLSEVSKAYGGRTLFAGASLSVTREDRLGLVGPNGTGKSTLFSLILGSESPDAGKIEWQRGMSVGHLPQESAPASDETVLELATAVTPEITALRRRVRAFEAGHDHDSADFHEVQAHFDHLGGFQLRRPSRRVRSQAAAESFRHR
jgi:ATP-binding cassette subfamily F protein 3